MFEALSPRLKGGAPVQSRTVTVDLPEGAIAATLEDVQSRHAGVEIGSYPFYRGRAFGVKLVLRTVDEARLAAATAELVEALAGLGGAPVEDEETG
jgi:molybdopterin-biosynthesis enzyme MoeA-like protein